jgi:hypothetical protein
MVEIKTKETVNIKSYYKLHPLSGATSSIAD